MERGAKAEAGEEIMVIKSKLTLENHYLARLALGYYFSEMTEEVLEVTKFT